MNTFQKLSQPGRIGNIEIKNRIIMASLATSFMDADGSVNDRQIAYYVERARGGIGLIMTETAYSRAKPYPGRLEINDDRFIPGLSRLASAVHDAGAKIALQICVGRGRNDVVECLSASGVPTPGTGVTPRVMNADEIEIYIKDFGESARRAREAGFDGIELHAIGGYLLADFLSPFTNRRKDEYGGSIENRARFALELIKAAKERAGTDYPFICKLMANEHLEGGLQLKDAIVIAQLMEKYGADAIEVHSGTVAVSPEWAMPPMRGLRCCNVAEANAIKKNVSIPVIVGGRIVEPEEAEAILGEGSADFISVARAVLADPEWPQKALTGRAKEIRKCIGCLHCLDCILVPPQRAVTCSVNPGAGEEKDFVIEPAAKRKRVLIIGGGPGGMEAARICARRGHDVSIWEKGEKPGGQLNLAMKPPFKVELEYVTEFLTQEIKRLGVKVELGKEGTAEAILAYGPEAVIIATGARPSKPNIPGINGPNVITAIEALADDTKVGKDAVIIGGGLIGCETAEYLVSRGRKVMVIEMTDKLAVGLNSAIKRMLLASLENAGVKILTGCEPVEINKDGVKVKIENSLALFPAGTVIIATGMKPNNELSGMLENRVSELYTIGDSAKPGLIFDCIYQAAHVAVKI